jgi:hypothetical protein
MNSVFFSCRRSPDVLKDQPEHLQAAGRRGDERDRAEELHPRDRVLRVLQAATSQTISRSQSQRRRRTLIGLSLFC